ncbi:glycosyltransferase family 4 protein [Sphingomonas sp. Y38-1Y]|uniref:glycosyltransferase family 4 protein n=1 Tax=Sphingomonas sp. Y38-1Y TaxID=3078265 RepID=UPI0028ED4030|nr:glycosyltransferase family 4 protein [Sphingomonas sp. Y38-1Y]
MGEPLNVAVVYHVWPHYRAAVMAAMDRSARVRYTFFGSSEWFRGIEPADVGAVRRFVRAPFAYHGRLMWQRAAVAVARDRRFDAIVYLGDPNFVSTWIGAAIARLRGVPVLFWAHGWLRREVGAKRMMRRAFYALADRMLVYAERGRALGIAAGHDPARITVVYNSLDVARADAIVAEIEGGGFAEHRPQALFAAPDRPLLICTARLTPLCRFDLLFEAAARLAGDGMPVNILLIGDGPSRAALEHQAKVRGLAVHFFGACYDERVLGPLTYHADLTVSPGKIGLTAIHSLMYGTPAITHGDLDTQMPEVEAIEPGVTGALFEAGDVASLAATIRDWLAAPRSRAAVRESARGAIHARWNPETQARIVEQVVLDTVAARRTRR